MLVKEPNLQVVLCDSIAEFLLVPPSTSCYNDNVTKQRKTTMNTQNLKQHPEYQKQLEKYVNKPTPVDAETWLTTEQGQHFLKQQKEFIMQKTPELADGKAKLYVTAPLPCCGQLAQIGVFSDIWDEAYDDDPNVQLLRQYGMNRETIRTRKNKPLEQQFAYTRKQWKELKEADEETKLKIQAKALADNEHFESHPEPHLVVLEDWEDYI